MIRVGEPCLRIPLTMVWEEGCETMASAIDGASWEERIVSRVFERMASRFWSEVGIVEGYHGRLEGEKEWEIGFYTCKFATVSCIHTSLLTTNIRSRIIVVTQNHSQNCNPFILE